MQANSIFVQCPRSFKYYLYLRCYLDDASILPCLIKRYGCVGGLINNEPFFCGGEYDTGNKFDDGFVVAQPNKKLQMLEKRFGAAGVGKHKFV